MKRIISLILAILTLSLSTTAFAYSTDDFASGDVDMNGVINICDATAIQKQLVDMVNLNPEQMVLADTDSDGEVTIMDATKIQKSIVCIDELDEEKKEMTYSIGEKINVYFTNKLTWTNVHFYLYNSKTNEQAMAWPGEKITTYEINSLNQKVYYNQVDLSKFDRIIFNDGKDRQTVNIPLTKASSGFVVSNSSNSKAMLVNNYAHKSLCKGTTKTTTLTYSQGYEKKIWVYTPSNYNPDATSGYKTIYMMDGQNLFEDNRDGHGGWQVINGIESMIQNGGEGVIIVGIDNGNNKRDSELTPNLGAPIPKYNSYANGTGEAFSNFVVNTVMPYVQANYNSSTEACDNIIAGSSSGGIEAFYIGMEHKDKFGGIGALSPAFVLFDSTVWNSYLSKYNLTAEDMPKLYIFNGKGDDLERELCVSAESMYSRLITKGYNESKITLVVEDGFSHNEAFWRIIFPDMVSWIMGL